MFALLIGVYRVREILFLALEWCVQIYKREVFLLSHLLDIRNDAIVDDAVIDAPCVTVGRYWQAEPDFGLGGERAE